MRHCCDLGFSLALYVTAEAHRPFETIFLLYLLCQEYIGMNMRLYVTTAPTMTLLSDQHRSFFTVSAIQHAKVHLIPFFAAVRCWNSGANSSPPSSLKNHLVWRPVEEYISRRHCRTEKESAHGYLDCDG